MKQRLMASKVRHGGGTNHQRPGTADMPGDFVGIRLYCRLAVEKNYSTVEDWKQYLPSGMV